MDKYSITWLPVFWGPQYNRFADPVDTWKKECIRFIHKVRNSFPSDEQKRIWRLYTNDKITEENFRDVSVVMNQTYKSWEESLRALVDTNWDMVSAILILT